MRILVLHALRPTSRTTTIDHVLALSRHRPHDEIVCLHFAQPFPAQLRQTDFDLTVVNYDFLNYRFTPLWPFVKDRHRFLRDRSRRLVAVTQDDFFAHRLLDDWVADWDVDEVLTPLDTDLEVLYPRSLPGRRFTTVLTGYIEPGNLTRFADLAVPLAERPVDLGQRVRHMPANLGRLAQAKSHQAMDFARLVADAGLVTDVSNDVADAFVGDDWFRFLGRCRFTVGMKGGASLPDPDGSIRLACERYLAAHPDAGFDEIAAHCLPAGQDRYAFTAPSPRLFEAAAMGTCQILAPDDYVGLLQPWEHYLPLAPDMSNAAEVIAAMRDLDRCQQIADECRRTLLAAPVAQYPAFVDALLGDATTQPYPPGDLAAVARFLARTEVFARRDSALLSDAVQLWLHDARMSGRLGQVARLIDAVAAHGTAPVPWQDAVARVAAATGDVAGDPTAAAGRSVLAHATAAGLLPELRWHWGLARARMTDARMVWPWRPAEHFAGPRSLIQ